MVALSWLLGGCLDWRWLDWKSILEDVLGRNTQQCLDQDPCPFTRRSEGRNDALQARRIDEYFFGHPRSRHNNDGAFCRERLEESYCDLGLEVGDR